MQAYRNGDADAFASLYAPFAGRLRSYFLSRCRDSTLADDLLQDTFMQIHKWRCRYRPGLPVTPWVYGIARNVYLMKRRSTGRRIRFEDALQAAGGETHGPDALDAIVTADQMRRGLRRLPLDQRHAVVMHFVYGWSFKDISAQLGIRVNAAKTRGFRGRKKLREFLAGGPALPSMAHRGHIL